VRRPDAEYKEAFALFDKKGTGAVPRETLGDLLRALGQNPTQAEVAEIVSGAPRDGASTSLRCVPYELMRTPYS
jgi:Ca2+-binding EF-hand superfamily protein